MQYCRTRQTPALRDCRSGFTLAELVVVLSILAVMSLSVSPIFHSALRDTRAEHGVSDFAAALKYAQSRSISDAVEYRVYLNAETRVYWVVRAAGPDAYPPAFERMPDRYRDDISLPRGLTLDRVVMRREASTDFYYVSFFPTGATDVAEVELGTASEGGTVFLIRVTGSGVKIGERS